MHPRLRTLLIVAVAMILAVIAGYQLATESYTLSGIVLVALLWLFLDWTGGPRPEVWVLAVVLAGYIIGNRGFAQASLVAWLPLIPAETALLVGVPAMLFRAAFRQVSFLRRDALDFTILAWMLVAAARLPLDWQRHGVIALRDFAMIYYAAFFFLAQAIANHRDSMQLLRRALTGAILVLPAVALAFQRWPDFFFTYVTLRGNPLVFHKSDLIATSLAAGFFWLWMHWEETRRRGWLVAAAVALATIAAMPSPRAAMVATAGVTGLWLVARRWGVPALQLATVVAGIAALAPWLLFSETDPKQTPLYSAYEHAISIVDFDARGTYQNRDSGDPGDNNRFRLVWWQTVAGETWDENPVYGLGFGHDLSEQFLIEYGLLGADDFSARSPHSMLLSMLGRLGALGLGLWLAIAALMARRSLPVFRRGRDFAAMGLWSVAWVYWISACFGVVLEGPMGAVLFWTTLGLAHARSDQPATSDEPETLAYLPAAGAAAEVRPTT